MKTVVITGANSGIGFQAARLFANAGDRLVLLCRPGQKTDRAMELIRDESNNPDISLIEVDLSEPESIEAAVDQIQAKTQVIDVLVNNAGLQKKHFSTDSRGVEMSLAVNFRAPFILAEGLKDLLAQSHDARIVNVVSELYKKGKFPIQAYTQAKGYNAGKAYANSKRASVLMSQEMARRYAANKIGVFCLHPGVLATDALRDYSPLMMNIVGRFLEKPEIGGKRIFDLATLEKYSNQSGAYLYKDEIRDLDKRALNQTDQGAAWELAERLAAGKPAPTDESEVSK
jgi:NAD(P)-dependent dehydrogenase (short-subunit alcohol dehydrogenase family)